MNAGPFSEFPHEVIEARLRSFKQQCLAEENCRARAWWFSDGPRSPALVGRRIFEVPGRAPRMHLVDQYHGRTPTLINRTTLTKGPNVQIGLRPFLLLDSNAVAYIEEFLAGGGDENRRTVVDHFLRFVLSGNYEFTAVFYLVESLVRADPGRWLPFAKRLMSAVFSLQTLDRQLFLTTGTLASSLEARASTLAYHGVPTADGLIRKYVSAVGRDTALREADAVDLSYAALLKIGLLGSERAPLEVSESKFAGFLLNQLGAALGFEHFLAFLHWAAPARFAKLIPPLQASTNFGKFKRKLRGTAWDLRLARMPEQLGRFIPRERVGVEAVCNLYYVVTGEDALADLVEQRTIELLIQQPDPMKSVIVAGHYPDLLNEILGVEKVNRLSFEVARWEEQVMASADRRSPIGGSELRGLIETLESNVAAVCR